MAGVIQSYQFYPFGMAFAEGTTTEQGKQEFKYNGKELDRTHELNQYDYSARYYDPGYNRFTTQDPLSEKYYSISPYVYVANNPMKFVDPDGRSYTDYVRRDGTRSVEVNDGNSTIESIEPLPETVVYPNYGWTASTQGGVTRQYNQYDSPLTRQSLVVGEAPLEQVNIEFDMLLMGRLAVNAASSVAAPAIAENTVQKGSIEITKKTFGHTFERHGESATNFLLKRAEGSGMAQGQFLDNQKAAKFILDNVGKTANGAVNIPIPKGFPARVIMPDGAFQSATHIRLIPGGSGVKTAYPLIP